LASGLPLQIASDPNRFAFSATLCPTLTLIFLLFGCASQKPSPEPPAAVRVAQGTTERAARLSQMQSWPAAAREWQTATDQYHLLNDRTNEAVALHNLAQAKRELGEPRESRNLLERAAAINEELKRDREWWRNQTALLQVDAQLNQAEALGSRFEKLLPRAKEIIDSEVHGLFVNELGLWQQSRSQFVEAQSSFQQAEQLFQSAGIDYGVAVATANRAHLCERQKNFAAAVEIWRTALRRFEKLGDARGIAEALAGEGRSLLESSGNLTTSEELLRRAAQSYRTLKRSNELAETLGTLEACLAAQHKDAEATAIRAELQQLQPRNFNP
jgi:tetratricopeptide (TPR) repeat protein